MLASLELRSALASPPLHRELSAMVSRRVPRPDVEDVVQSVLCDALAAGNVPADPSEVPRWVMGIARHKIADFHRRIRRQQQPIPVEAVAVDPSEDRDLLRRVLGETASGAQARTLLDWIAREHAGERLADIAAEERLDPAVVRQRVSRFRKLMRARWLLVAAGALFLLGVARARPFSFESLGAERRAVTAQDTSRSFRVAEVTVPPAIDGATAELLEAEARLSSVTLRGSSVTIVTPVRTLRGRIEMTDQARGRLRLEDSRVFEVEVRDEGNRLVLRHRGGAVVLQANAP